MLSTFFFSYDHGIGLNRHLMHCNRSVAIYNLPKSLKWLQQYSVSKVMKSWEESSSLFRCILGTIMSKASLLWMYLIISSLKILDVSESCPRSAGRVKPNIPKRISRGRMPNRPRGLLEWTDWDLWFLSFKVVFVGFEIPCLPVLLFFTLLM